MKNVKVLLVFVVALFIVAGCASKSKVQPDSGAAGTGEAYVDSGDTKRYVVNPKDTLWDISGKIYGDNFQWPLIFRANRDQIQDPDIIEIGQALFIRKDFTRNEILDAKQKAMDTPPYVPHTRPRKTLPLQY